MSGYLTVFIGIVKTGSAAIPCFAKMLALGAASRPVVISIWAGHHAFFLAVWLVSVLAAVNLRNSKDTQVAAFTWAEFPCTFAC